MWVWDQESTDKLTQLWDAGATASVIAEKIGNITRSAVLGRLMRLRESGVPVKDRQRAPQKKRVGLHIPRAKGLVRLARPAAPWKPPRRLLEPVEPPVVILRAHETEPNGMPVGLLELCSAACKWPVSDSLPHLFCNKIRRGGSSYCDEHTLKSYQPPKPRSPEMQRGKHEVPFR